MAITKDEVRHVAKLARLEMSDDDIMKYTSQLSSILEYMDILNELDTKNLEPTAQVTGLLNVIREDKVSSYVLRDELLRCTNLTVQDKQIRVKSVFIS